LTATGDPFLHHYAFDRFSGYHDEKGGRCSEKYMRQNITVAPTTSGLYYIETLQVKGLN